MKKNVILTPFLFWVLDPSHKKKNLYINNSSENIKPKINANNLSLGIR